MSATKDAGGTHGLIDFARRRPAVVLVVVVLGGLYFAGQAKHAATTAVLIPGVDLGDPSLITDGRTTYAYGTDPSSPRAVQVLSSRDRKSWKILPNALPRLPDWAEPENGGVGSAAVAAFGDGFVMYYTSTVRGLGIRCISAATAPSADGPFRDTSLAPFICQTADGGSAEPAPFTDAAGHAYLAWSSPGSGPGAVPTLWAQRLRSDGLVLTGDPGVLLRPSLPWQVGRIGDPSMIAADGRFDLLYSAAPPTTDRRAVASAVCDGPTGPCKPADKPLLTSGTVGSGPGAAHAFTDSRDRWWVGLHSWDSQPAGGSLPTGRFVIAPLDVGKDGVGLRIDSLSRGRVRSPDEEDPADDRHRRARDGTHFFAMP